MEQSLIVLLVVGLLYLPNTALSVDWSYSGEKGYHKWPEHFKHCRGRQQSPINVDTDHAQFDSSLSAVHLQMPHDAVGRMILIHNGHTLQVNTIGDYYVLGGGLPSNYRIAQFHLHWGKNNHKGSEHQIDGHSYPMELHVVAYDYMNYSSIGEAMKSPMGLAVLGTLYTISDDDNPVLEPILKAVQDVKDPDEKDTTSIEVLHLTDLLPSSTSRYYRYNGSLTTPGCYESVVWTVFEEKQYISKRQLRLLRGILRSADSHSHHKDTHMERETVVDNFRPVQPLNGRTVYRSFPKKGEVPTAAMKSKHAVWSYKGETGPDQWKAIYPDAGCAGSLQSPINIAEHKTKYEPSLRDFDLQIPSKATNPTMTVYNNGHTIKVSVDAGSGDYMVRGGSLPSEAQYKIAQLHFHWGGENNKGSEHHVNGHAYPIEMHIVTWDSGNYASIMEAMKEPQGLAVLGVLFEISNDDNAALQPIVDVMEQVEDPELDKKIKIPALLLEDLLPEDTSRYFRYNGSLTTPGCFESVVWTVFKETKKLSHKQLRQFREILKHQDATDDGHKLIDVQPSLDSTNGNDELVKIGDVLRERLVDNYRPVQPINDRVVLRSYKDIDTKRKRGGSHKHSWSYAGHTGPHMWPDMEERCNGKQQSPINIVTSQTDFNPKLKDFTFYDSKEMGTKMTVKNNGHTVKVTMNSGVHYVYGGGLPSTYQTLQLHFHWGSTEHQGSEHTVDGQAFPLELHVVNYDSKYSSVMEAIDKPQGLAVLGVLFYMSKEDNEVLEPILETLPHVKDPDSDTEQPVKAVSIESLMPHDTSKYYRYNGSLTTPGCYESVVWTVFDEKLPISYDQMQKFRELFFPREKDDDITGHTDTVDNPSDPHSNGHSKPTGADVGTGGAEAMPEEITNSGRSNGPNMVDNFRPVQPLHGRRVWRSFRLSGEKKRKHHWGYEGAGGPQIWAEMYPDKECDGQHQSPINIHRNQTRFDANLRDVNIWFDPPLPGSKMTVKNNGHTVQVNVKGKYFITGAGLTKVYKTVQFHFHWGGPGSDKLGSEHTVDSEAYPLELHIVNYDSETYASITEAMTQPLGLAVFGVFYELAPDDNPVLQTIIDALEHVEDPNDDKEVQLKPLSVKYFLPKDKSRYYRYNGSLTTPGCHESVIWTLFEQPQTISKKQLKKFWNMFQMDHSESLSGISYDSGHDKRKKEHHGGAGTSEGVVVGHPGSGSHHRSHNNPRKRIRTNFRPVQPVNDRVVYRSFKDFSGIPEVASSRFCSGTNIVVSSFSLKTFIILTFTIKWLSHL
ncbi:uncharacterized protein LOC135466815 [Liolophura sinensis]|uniref:uncharacterized protein LOC135466815 n=1 Tax=Liolophura sinensis TaxID=3198878 RepID=UPI00315956EE